MEQKESNAGGGTENFNLLSADNPLIDPNHDRLGYAPFAKNLAESICKMAPPQGFVMAVYAPWGSGKSTLLNFIVHYLEQKRESEQPIIVPFNPWWFSGQEDLTRHFFDQLLAVLSTKLQSFSQEMKERLENFAQIVSRIPGISIVEALAKSSNPAVEPTMLLFKSLVHAKDVYKLKEDIEKELRNQQKRILVVIDDIDRLTAEEIRQLFRVIKAVANFPNIIYLLLFDKEVVVKALAETQRIPGEAYLEKIVQVPFELPLPNKTSLRGLLFEKLSVILTDTPNELFDQTDWGNVYLDGIDFFITTPRSIVRLTNTLSVTYPAVKGEVNSVDFIAIESLRVFCPMIYDIIRKNPEAFTGHADTEGFHGLTVDKLKLLHNSWIEQVREEDKEPVKQMLLRLFPKLQAVWGNTYYGAESESSWRRQLRICSLEIFPIYFRLAVPEGDLSNTKMKAILALANDGKAFGEKLIELANQKRPDEMTQVRIFLERLEDYTEKEISLDCIPSIVQALFNVGDQLLRSEDENRGMFDFGNNIRIGRIIYQLCRRLDEPKRFEVLKEAILNGNALSTIVHKVAVFGQEQGKHVLDNARRPEKEWSVSVEHLKELEKIALEKVRRAAQQDVLIQVSKLPSILYFWRELSSEEEVKQWVQEVISSDERLIIFLEKFIQKTFSHSASDVVSREQYRLDSKQLEPFLEPSKIIDRARRLTEDNRLTENQKIAIRQFIQEYDLINEQTSTSEQADWSRLTAEQFLAGYEQADIIYDTI